eukprot:358720-Chlamydomonas_euryale.AAC.1
MLSKKNGTGENEQRNTQTARRNLHAAKRDPRNPHPVICSPQLATCTRCSTAHANRHPEAARSPAQRAQPAPHHLPSPVFSSHPSKLSPATVSDASLIFHAKTNLTWLVRLVMWHAKTLRVAARASAGQAGHVPCKDPAGGNDGVCWSDWSCGMQRPCGWRRG